MGEEMRAQPFCEVRPFGQLEDARIVNNAGAYIAAAERNDPAPPAVAHEVIGRPVPAGAARVRVVTEFFPPFITVPIFHVVEACPDGVDRMLEVRLEMAELACE